jgi:hypothetical protein
VEYHVHPSELSHNAEHYWHQDPREWATGYHHVIMRGDVPPDQIVAIHEPWHGAARYMRDDDPTLQRYQWIKDETDPVYEPYERGLRALERRTGGFDDADIEALHEPHDSHRTAAARAARYFHNTIPGSRQEISRHGLQSARDVFPEEFGHLGEGESAGDADYVWFHRLPEHQAIPHSDTWELTRPDIYDLEEDDNSDTGAAPGTYVKVYRGRIDPAHLRLLYESQLREHHDADPADRAAAVTTGAQAPGRGPAASRRRAANTARAAHQARPRSLR